MTCQTCLRWTQEHQLLPFTANVLCVRCHHVRAAHMTDSIVHNCPGPCHAPSLAQCPTLWMLGHPPPPPPPPDEASSSSSSSEAPPPTVMGRVLDHLADVGAAPAPDEMLRQMAHVRLADYDRYRRATTVARAVTLADALLRRRHIGLRLKHRRRRGPQQ